MRKLGRVSAECAVYLERKDQPDRLLGDDGDGGEMLRERCKDQLLRLLVRFRDRRAVVERIRAGDYAAKVKWSAETRAYAPAQWITL